MYYVFTIQVADTLDGLLEELHYLHNQVEHADPIAANPDSLREQINENNVSRKLVLLLVNSNVHYHKKYLNLVLSAVEKIDLLL